MANFDRSESDLTPLSAEEQKLLEQDGRSTFITGLSKLMEKMVDDSTRAELFRYLMILFLIILVGEVVMTRRLVQGGHVDGDLHPDAEESQIREPARQSA